MYPAEPVLPQERTVRDLPALCMRILDILSAEYRMDNIQVTEEVLITVKFSRVTLSVIVLMAEKAAPM